MELTFEQARVLGSLVEKQMTTPDHYPLTVNALVSACNQRNNRDPVTAFSDEEVERILSELNDLDLSRFTRQSGGRTLKYLHRGPQTLQIDDEQLAILAIMLLRGPQTVNELKTRTVRYIDFASTDAVEDRIQDLITRDEPLVEQLPHETGQRETRFMTTLVPDHPAATSGSALPLAATPARPNPLQQRVEVLEATVAHLLDQLGMDYPPSVTDSHADRSDEP